MLLCLSIWQLHQVQGSWYSFWNVQHLRDEHIHTHTHRLTQREMHMKKEDSHKTIIHQQKQAKPDQCLQFEQRTSARDRQSLQTLPKLTFLFLLSKFFFNHFTYCLSQNMAGCTVQLCTCLQIFRYKPGKLLHTQTLIQLWLKASCREKKEEKRRTLWNPWQDIWAVGNMCSDAQTDNLPKEKETKRTADKREV